jgi:hypothetical protein
MARCFTFGADAIGDLNATYSTDGTAFRNYNSWMIAAFAFSGLTAALAKEYIEFQFDEFILVGAILVLAFSGGAAYPVIGGIGGLGKSLNGMIDTIVEFVTGGSEKVKEAYNVYQTAMKEVHWVNGHFLNWSSDSTTTDYIAAFVECALHTINCSATCLSEASK